MNKKQTTHLRGENITSFYLNCSNFYCVGYVEPAHAMVVAEGRQAVVTVFQNLPLGLSDFAKAEMAS